MRQGAIRNAVLDFALSVSVHSADAHGIAGNRFFVGTLTFDDPSVADEPLCRIFPRSIIRSKVATPPITASIGLPPGCLRRFSRSKLTAVGYTATGQQRGPQGLRQPMSASKAKSIATISTKCSYPRGWRFTGACPFNLLPDQPFYWRAAKGWQFAAEVIVPLNRDAGGATGFRAQLLSFLDDLIPKLFDKLLLSDKPDRSLIAWH